MHDSEKIRAVAEEAAKKGYFPTADVERAFRAEVTPSAVLSMLDEIASLKLALKNMGLDADHAREEAERLKADLKALSDMYTYAWDRVDGGLVMFDIERFETVHKNARIALGTPLLDLDTGEPEV